MTLLTLDGFDHHTKTGFIRKGWTARNASLIDMGSANSRFGGQGLGLPKSDYFVRRNIGVNKSTIYFGMAIKIYGVGTPGYYLPEPLMIFEDEALVDQIKLYVNSGFGIDVRNPSESILGSTADAVIFRNAWFYLEGKVTISDTVGEVTLRINETQVLNLTNEDTKVGSDYIRYINIYGIYHDVGIHVDDFYIDDAQFHGDCQIKTFFPDLDGNSADFTRSTGSNDYECVDETLSNGDTDYISSNTLNHKSIFGITTGALSTVKGIQVNNDVRVDEAGVRKIKPIIRSNGADYQGIETGEISASYIFENEIWELDPDDSGAWDQTKLEAAEFGLEITT